MKEISLSQNKVALVDDEDYDFLSQWKWQVTEGKTGKFYAVRMQCIPKSEIRKRIFMHRLIMKAPDNIDVDHKKGNGLNNQKENLRLATKSQNAANRKKPKNNTSGFKGVSWDRARNKWLACIRFNYKNIHLGRFIDRIDAVKSYDKKAKELFGEFAQTNF
jgi:hypothetical protein